MQDPLESILTDLQDKNNEKVKESLTKMLEAQELISKLSIKEGIKSEFLIFFVSVAMLLFIFVIAPSLVGLEIAAAAAGYLFINLTLINIFVITPHYSKPLKKAINSIQDEIALQEKISSMKNDEKSKIEDKYQNLSAKDLLDIIECKEKNKLYKRSILQFFNQIEIQKESLSVELKL